MESGLLSEYRLTFITITVDWWNNFHPIVALDSLFVYETTAQVEGEMEFLRGVRSIDNLHSHPHGVRRVVPNHCVNAIAYLIVVVQKDIVTNSRWVDFPDWFTQDHRFIVQSEFNILFSVWVLFFLSRDLELKPLWFRSNILFVLEIFCFVCSIWTVWIEIELTFADDLAVNHVLSCDQVIPEIHRIFKLQARTWPLWSRSDCEVCWLGVRPHGVEKGSIYHGVFAFHVFPWWHIPFGHYACIDEWAGHRENFSSKGLNEYSSADIWIVV